MKKIPVQEISYKNFEGKMKHELAMNKMLFRGYVLPRTSTS